MTSKKSKEESKRLGFDVTKKYGHLTWVKSVEDVVYRFCDRHVSGIGYSRQPASLWRCDCGSTIIAANKLIITNKDASCGCIQKSKHRIKHIWYGMRKRCYQKGCIAYPFYGGRGITMCDEWFNDFNTFYTWSIQNGYSDTLSIDRIDVNGNYCPDNCRWATRHVQGFNKTNTIRVSVDGKLKTIDEMSKESGLPWSVIYGRISGSRNKEHSSKDIYSTPNRKLIKINGEEKTIGAWLKESDISYSMYFRRTHDWGWTPERAITTPRSRALPKKPREPIHPITINGVTKGLNAWCAEYGICPGTVRSRMANYGWDYEKAITTKSATVKRFSYAKH